MARAETIAVEPGTEIVQAGEHGESYYLVEDGTVDVEIKGLLIDTLGPGEGLGERPLLRGSPRSATVRASTPTRLLRISRDAFLGAVAGPAEIELSRAAPAPSRCAGNRSRGGAGDSWRLPAGRAARAA